MAIALYMAMAMAMAKTSSHLEIGLSLYLDSSLGVQEIPVFGPGSSLDLRTVKYSVGQYSRVQFYREKVRQKLQYL